MSPRIYVYALLALLVGLALWKGADVLVDRGIAKERAEWVKAQAQADREQEERRRAAQEASDSIADSTRDDAQTATRDARDATTTTIEKIRYVYRDQPVPECPPPAVPVGVRDELGAAYDAARAAAR